MIKNLPCEQKLVLASSSRYRRQLLDRLGIPYTAVSPHVDETPRSDEKAADTAKRLALSKARAVAKTYPESLIIGSDQVALLEGELLGKPHTHEKAVLQLQKMRGKTVVFHTALCLLDAKKNEYTLEDVPTQLLFRNLSNEQIENYLRREQPYDCAGSAKSEGLGIALIQSMQGEDPNALIGLPLIKLVSMLEQHGLKVI
ncbi:MAG: septum formation inhibitor Maf [Proteobacteria bacterium]|nr:septum formation inhibitor Maf [Pseudomonadota bacterium]